jgi:hypothetical protein
MKAYGVVDVQIHIFLTAALVGGEWSASRPDRFTLCTHCIGGWVDPRASLDNMEKFRSLVYIHNEFLWNFTLRWISHISHYRAADVLQSAVVFKLSPIYRFPLWPVMESYSVCHMFKISLYHPGIGVLNPSRYGHLQPDITRVSNIVIEVLVFLFISERSWV